MRPARFVELLDPLPRFGVRVTERERTKLRRALERRHYSMPLDAMLLGRRLLRRSRSPLALREFDEDIRRLCRLQIMRIRYTLKGRLSIVASTDMGSLSPPGKRDSAQTVHERRSPAASDRPGPPPAFPVAPGEPKFGG
jgi:hypothetical protein